MTKKAEATLIIGKTSKIFASLFQIQSDNWFVKIFLSHGLLFYIAIVIAIATQIILNRTRVGLHLRAVGENPATADAAGINVTGYRYGATIIGSAIAALGGLFTIMEYMGGNWEYILEGFGWLSVALVIFTVWRPALSILGSLIFGGLYISAAYINVSFAQTELLKTVPYVITILVLIVTSIVGSKKAQPPASLGINYFREDR
jgi:simple sugar transport system permease protein